MDYEEAKTQMAHQSNELEEMRSQYDAMKKSQLTLTEMNK